VEREELPDDAQALLPDGADSVTIFVNPRSVKRDTMTACVSFDSGETWVKTKLIWEAACAYSSLAYSPADGHFYLLYERGEANPYEHGIAVREFDLAWLLNE